MRVILSKLVSGKRMLAVLLLIITITLALLPGCFGGGTPTRGWSGVITANGNLYVGGMDGKVYAVNGTNGVINWATELEPLPTGGWFQPTSFAAIYSTPAISGNMVYAGSYMLTGSAERGRIFGINATSGDIVWRYPVQGSLNANVIGSIAVSNGTVFASATDRKIYALDAATGVLKWKEPFTTGDQVWAGPVVDGDTVYVGSLDKKLYALDAATGEEKWDEPFTADGAIATTALIKNGTIYVGSYNRRFYAVNAADGTKKWHFPVEGDINIERGFWATPVIIGNAIFIPCLDGKVYIRDANTGGDLGSAKLADYLSSSPTTLGDNAVVATPEDGKLFLLSSSSFNAPAFIELKTKILAPLGSADDTVYIHTYAPERIYAMDTTGRQKWNPLDLQKR